MKPNDNRNWHCQLDKASKVDCDVLLVCPSWVAMVGGVLTTADYQWPRTLRHVALRSSLKWTATESVSLIHRDTCHRPQESLCLSPSVPMKQTIFSNIWGQTTPPPPPPRASFTPTDTHCASERFQVVALCECCSHTDRGFQWQILKSAGKSAGQFNGHCFTQSVAFSGCRVVFPLRWCQLRTKKGYCHYTGVEEC